MTYYLSSKHHHRALVLMPERILMDTKCMTLPMSTQRFDLRGQMWDEKASGSNDWANCRRRRRRRLGWICCLQNHHSTSGSNLKFDVIIARRVFCVSYQISLTLSTHSYYCNFSDINHNLWIIEFKQRILYSWRFANAIYYFFVVVYYLADLNHLNWVELRRFMDSRRAPQTINKKAPSSNWTHDKTYLF